MDDIIPPSTTLESLQRKTNVISAFYIIFGVDVTIHKLRSYVANWSSTIIENNPTLLVHRGDWVAHAVQ